MRASRLSISILCVLISACGAARPIKYYKLEIPSAPPSPAVLVSPSRFRSAISRMSSAKNFIRGNCPY